MAHPNSVEVLLRPAVELYTVAVCAGAAILCLVAPWSLALSPLLGLGSALAFLTFGAIRLRDAWAILRYRRNIRRLPRYVMTSRDVPVSQQRLFVGRGFRWDQRHAPADADLPAGVPPLYVDHRDLNGRRGGWRERLEFAPFPLSRTGEGAGLGQPAQPRRVHYRRSAVCRACTASSRTRSTSRCRWPSASVIRSCSAPPASARPAWPSCSSPGHPPQGGRPA